MARNSVAEPTELPASSAPSRRNSAEPSPRFWKVFYLWTRDLHLYTGLFISPFVVVFAVSAVMFNHGWLPGAGNPSETYTASVIVPDEENSILLAKDILRQLGVRGEIDFVRREEEAKRILIPVEQPGASTRVVVDVAAGQATVERRERGLSHALTYLHLRPGQHLADIRGNWIYMHFWRWMADVTVYLTLFSTVSGVYLWTVLKAERKVGLVMLGLGVLSFALTVLAVVR